MLKFDKLVHYGSRRPQNYENPLSVNSKMGDGAYIGRIQSAVISPWIVRLR